MLVCLSFFLFGWFVYSSSNIYNCQNFQAEMSSFAEDNSLISLCRICHTSSIPSVYPDVLSWLGMEA